jgi:hypothetical protein
MQSELTSYQASNKPWANLLQAVAKGSGSMNCALANKKEYSPKRLVRDSLQIFVCISPFFKGLEWSVAGRSPWR